MTNTVFSAFAGLLILGSTMAFAQEGGRSLSLSNPQVTAIAQDRDGYIWFGTSRGLNRYNGSTYTTYFSSGGEFSLSNDHILSLCADSDGILWIGTECGLNWYREGKFHHLNSSVFNPVSDIREVDSLHVSFKGKSGEYLFDKESMSLVNSIPGETDLSPGYPIVFTDRDGGVWASDGRNGYTYTAKNQPFNSIELSEGGERVSHPVIDREGYLWVRMGEHLSSYSLPEGKMIWQDTRHRCGGLFLNTEGDIIALMDGHYIMRYSVHGGIPHLKDTGRQQDEIYSISNDANGILWMSGDDFLIKVDPDRHVSRFSVEKPFSYLLPSPGRGRNFILGLSDGILEVMENGTVTPFGTDFQNVSALLMANDGSFWMGTYNDGLIHYNESDGSVERFDTSSGGMVGDIKSLIQDNDGNIWISTATHISRYNPWTRTLSALRDNRFRDGRFYDLLCSAKDSRGNLYFGGSGCLTVIEPMAFTPGPRDMPLRMEMISVNERQVWEGSRELVLSHKENNLQLVFAGIDFPSGTMLNYTWTLEGYDKFWHTASTSPQAAYTRLPAGRYLFRARVREQNGPWSSQEIALPIIINPAPWARPWMITMYWLTGIIAAMLGIAFLVRYRIQKVRLSVASQREEMNRQHIDFMTNISHEFRTPLSLIYGPAKQLEQSGLEGSQKEMAGMILRNAERLKTLSEQLLSSSGHDAGETLNVRENDLTSLIRSMSGMFRFASVEKEQRFTLDLPETCIGLFDTEKVSKIFGNLASNAIKYTPDGGHIGVSLVRDGSDAILSVSDDGIGIPEEKRGKIFERFERLGAEKSEIVGSGIGLNYAQGLAKAHKGAISYAPNEPRGSVFTFRFPIDAGSYPGAVADVPDNLEDMFVAGEDGGRDQTILIAEDTTELRLFLRDLFRERYNVILASDGLEAVDNMKLSAPDLILSDVVMPGKTGFELCSDVKSSEDWCHIPVVLLTARADADSSIEGMNAGADAYVSKPFDPEVLKATVESILRNRRILQEKVRNLTSADLKEESLDEIQLSPGDRRLLEKIQSFLDANLDNEDWDVAAMASELGMSYSSLYAKVKSLTGESPKSYVTAYRMNIARELLVKEDLTVSEVSYRIGSSSPAAFSREFKSHFGFPPKEAKLHGHKP